MIIRTKGQSVQQSKLNSLFLTSQLRSVIAASWADVISINGRIQLQPHDMYSTA